MYWLLEMLGIARSLLIYYGVPFRHRRMVSFYREFIHPGDLCFDVGAHVGNQLRAWRALGARVVAVEPHPAFAGLLRRLYARDPAVALVEAAIGQRTGTGELRISRRTPTVSSLSADWIDSVRQTPGFSWVRWDEAIPVQVATLDDLIGRFGVPSFCKLDVEGLEAQALRGLTLAIPGLSFEFIPAARDVALGCVDRLADLGNYEFNWSLGEGYRMESASWIHRWGIEAFLERVPPNGPSADVYARLKVDKSKSARDPYIQ